MIRELTRAGAMEEPGGARLASAADRFTNDETLVWIISAVVAVAFFWTEHHVNVALQIAYTQTADDMIATASGGNTAKRLIYVGLGMLGAALTLRVLRENKFQWSVLGVLIASMCGMLCVSVVWAQDQGMCLRRMFALACYVTGALGIGLRFSLRDLCKIAVVCTLSCVLIGILAEIRLGAFRPWSGDYRFSGSLHPNSQAMYLATLCASSLCLSFDQPRRRWTYASLCAFGLLMVFLTKSRTSLACVSGSVLLGLLIQLGSRWRMAIPFTIAWVLSGVVFLGFSTSADFERKFANAMNLGRQEEGGEALNGRSVIWPIVWEYIERRPWLGYGYESFWTPQIIENVSEECQWGVREAHSAYLDTMLSVGIIGMALLILTLLSGIVSAARQYAVAQDRCAVFSIVLGVYSLGNGFFESGMVMTILPSFLLLASLVRIGFVAPLQRAPR